MCGRLDVKDHPLSVLVSEQLGLDFQVSTNRDLRPTQQVKVIASNDGHLYSRSTEWGIQPAWAKRILINAQAESVMTKPTFKKAFAQSRCLVPCSGWYEWKTQEGATRKTKYRFSEANEQPLYMAGIYYPQQDSSSQLVTLTTEPTKQCAEFHHRMPLLIRPSEIEFWLHSDTDALAPLLSAPKDIELVVEAS
ncbi:SOS response-associated peptidase [Aliidiomarina indica]|uniref:SOS response-associated peptidase n=1 Tax=Aliidiomarina indica TaxID=2749147 RepID=UPI00188DD698|nr:SOS response-associated peptidase [Aliidiomarina indica]